jgi:hypothetical protein
MPRQARLGALDARRHIRVGGLERRVIFREDPGRTDLVARIAVVAEGGASTAATTGWVSSSRIETDPSWWGRPRTSWSLDGIGAATAAAAIGLIVAWIVERVRPRGRGALANLAMVPFAFPGMAFGVGLIIAYTTSWANLYGTLWLLLIGYVAKYISLGFTFIRDGLRQLVPEFEEMRFEIREIIRRLRITSLYVAHDQAEAMVLGDRIVIMREGRLEQIGAPEEIYWHSRTRFVASFVGVANLLAGEVTEAGPAEVSVAVAGVVLRGSLQDGETRPGLHEQVCLVVRPEDLEVRPCGQGPEENSLTGAIAVRTFLGHTVELRVDTAAGRLRAMAPTGCPHREGESVRLYIPPQRAVILRD